MQHWEIVKIELLFGFCHRAMRRNGEIVSESVDYEDYGTVKCFRMPASTGLFRLSAIGQYSTFRSVVQHQSGKKKAFRKKQDADDMHNPEEVSRPDSDANT